MDIRIVFLSIWIVTLGACSLDDTAKKQVSFTRYDRDAVAYTESTDSVADRYFIDKYSQFHPFYLTEILQINKKTLSHKTELKECFSHPDMEQLNKAVAQKFSDTEAIETELSEAFERYACLLPDDTLPSRVYTHVSGLQQQIVNVDTLLSVSLDHYLGSDFTPYRSIFAPYRLPRKESYYIVPDIMRVILYTRHPLTHEGESTLLREMLYEGKVVYCLQQILPDVPEERLLGYTPEQLQWCRDNETTMWNAILQQKDLYSTHPMLIAKYMAPAPFTAPLTQQSPGQAGRYIGWRIVSEYMHNTRRNASELWRENNELTILKTAKYNGKS